MENFDFSKEMVYGKKHLEKINFDVSKYKFVKLVTDLFNTELNKLHTIQEQNYDVFTQVGKDSNTEFHKKNQEEIQKKIKDLGLETDLINHKGLTPGMLLTLGEKKILTLNDFADLASDELIGGFDIIKGEKVKINGYLEDFALSRAEADDLIMTARDKIYKN